jgi:hypothetical protein
MTTMYDVPTGWLDSKSSNAPLQLVNAYAFAKSKHPPVDQWTHFATLRPVSWGFIIGLAVIVYFSGYGAVWAIFDVSREVPLIGWTMGPVLIISTIFFGYYAIALALAHRPRLSWPHLQGIGIGESGLSLRLAVQSTDVPWSAVTGIEATRTNLDNPAKAQIPVVRISYSDTHLDLNTAIFGSSPLVTFWALTYYWKFPQQRHELGTTVAQHRMDSWLAPDVLAPSPVAD